MYTVYGLRIPKLRDHSSFFFFFNFIYLWVCWVFVAVLGLLIVVASLVEEHGL